MIPVVRRQSYHRSVASAAATEFAALTSGGSTTLRNNFSGFVGFKITPNVNMTVTKLGRWKVSGNTGTHTVKITPFSAFGTILGSVSIDLTLFAAGDYAYVTLGSPVSLTSGTSYAVGSQEVSGGDQWYEQFTPTTTADFGTPGSIFESSGAWANNAPNLTYVPPNFKYTKP